MELVGRSLDDIAQELATLRCEKSALEGETARLNALMPELQTLRKENVDFRGALKFFVRQTQFVPGIDRSPSELPAEVVSVVFDELALITPSYEYNPDVHLGPHSPFMDHVRFQKGLTLLCKRWWEPATQALYKRVVIRHMGQISALARTLSATDAGYDFSSLVKDIALHECAILKPFSDVVLEDLRLILRRCTTLQSFSMVPHFNYSSGVWQWLGSALDVSWMAPGSLRSFLCEGSATRLLHLELPLATDSPSAIVELHHILSQATRLLSLRLPPLYLQNMEDEPPIALSTLPVLSMSGLNELQFSTRCCYFTDWATSYLQLPSLTSLTLLDHDGHIPIPFLVAHGGRLTYLHCYPPGNNPDRWQISSFDYGLRELAGVTPMIEHLIVCTRLVSKVLHELNYAKQPLLHLRHLDVWLHSTRLTRQRVIELSFNRYDATTARANREKFPALDENVRFLSYHGHSDLPKICHPSALCTDDETRALRIRDVCVVQTSWCVRANEDFAELHEKSNSATAASDEEEDPDFVPEDDEEDRTSWISEDASDSGSETGSADNGGEDSYEAVSEGLDVQLQSGLYTTLPLWAFNERWALEAVDSRP
ncbi:hypothetical protein OH76DRAFT_1481133 [Lentinus brumalis]|uniref:F-box domain-containing protein n=1 Tax=Lentinus brumalis TaxID=2498619 RepID=A0A371DHQ9_9APHY|nr:hypothetical protein OH76DRAFT_1481133 [Polyporus brumalis]